MDYGKAKLNKDDFLADMNATSDESYGRWLLWESKRVIRNRFILYGIAIIYFLIVIIIAIPILIDSISSIGEAADAVSLGASVGFLIGYLAALAVTTFGGLFYCALKIQRTFNLKKERNEMEIIFKNKYSENSSELNYIPSATPEELVNENNKLCRAVVRAKTRDEAESIVDNEKMWRDESSYGILFAFIASAFIGGLLTISIIYLIYYLYSSNKRKNKIIRARELVEYKFDTTRATETICDANQ
jgi:hypothetical protein